MIRGTNLILMGALSTDGMARRLDNRLHSRARSLMTRVLFDIGSLVFGVAGAIDLVNWAYSKWGF